MDRNLIPLGLDFETFYDTDYSLTRLTTAEYVLDPRFEIIGVGLVLGGALPVWYSGTHEKLRSILARIPWDRTELIAHNAMFDGSILEWILGFKPARYFCTMMGARPYIAPYTGSAALANCAVHFELGRKGEAVHNYRGRRRESLSAAELADYGEYCTNDTVLATRLAERLKGMLPDAEQDVIDLTIQKFTRPKLKLSQLALDTRLGQIQAHRGGVALALEAKGISLGQIRSRPKFASLLESKGVTVPTKVSPDTGAETFAMSKQDAPFVELLTHQDPEIRELVEARFLFASNMEETRLIRLRSIGGLSWPGTTDGCWLPVPLLYYGAHTGRFSGLDKINLQNLPRVVAGKPESGWLRRAIVAPPGYVIVAADLSNIEARIVATLAGQWDLVEAFRKGEDVYSLFASRIYGRPINKKDHPAERFVGKTCILGLGYGMGSRKFHQQMVLAKRHDITEALAQNIVYLYRDTYSQIQILWGHFERQMANATDPKCMIVDGPLTFLHQRVVLPNGMPIIYPKLRRTREGLAYEPARYNGTEIGLWGGAITENIVQALARIVLTTAELRLARAGLRSVLQVHDELVYCVPEKHVDGVKKAVEKALTAPVDWMPRLPVACEIGVGQSYAECK